MHTNVNLYESEISKFIQTCMLYNITMFDTYTIDDFNILFVVKVIIIIIIRATCIK